VLCLSFVFIFSIFKPKKSNLGYYILLLLIVFSVFTSGVRASIVALFISAIYYLLLKREFKFLVYLSIFSFAIYLTISMIPGLDIYVSSIFDKKGDKLEGSSLDMRYDQLLGSLNLINDNKLFGLGYGWSSYYISNFGNHPTLMAFESILFTILCNSGFSGIIIWCMMIIIYHYYISKIMRIKNFNLLSTLLIIYLIYGLLTGDYGYMKYFLLFYVIIIAGQEKNVIKNKSFTSQDYLSKNKVITRIDNSTKNIVNF